jgi:hypothetical protein
MVNCVVAVAVDIEAVTATFVVPYNTQGPAYLEQTVEPALPKSLSLRGASPSPIGRGAGGRELRLGQ